MRILMINSVCGMGSTGRICTDIAQALEKEGHTVKIAYGRGNVAPNFKKYAVPIGSKKDIIVHGMEARIFDRSGYGSKHATTDFIEWVREYKPDIIHLHNIHGYYININKLFLYLKNEFSGKILWTLHDCWSFTGHCVYCMMDKCEKWKTGCYRCEALDEYPKALLDNSKKNWIKKKALFMGIQDLTIITPSVWLENKVKESFLKEYKVEVINNGIDLSKFKITNGNIKEKYNIVDKKILLGVASVWDKRKGLSDFIELSKELKDEYKIVLIGLTNKQVKSIPNNIIGISKTSNVAELAAWYTVADMFLNPTYEDNYPTVNLEAIACGTPVLTYNTGGSPESILKYGRVVDKMDAKVIYESENIPFIKPDYKEIDISTMVNKYLELF